MPQFSSVLFPPGLTWGDPEKGSEDCDQLPSKDRGVPPWSRDWDPPLEGAPGTVLLMISALAPSNTRTPVALSSPPALPTP